MKKSNYFLIAIFLFLISCEKEIEIKFPEIENQLVADCFFTPDSIFKVFVTNTQSFNHYSKSFIPDALVKLYENEVFIENLQHIDSGFYVSNSEKKPEINKTYKIIISEPGYDEISADDIVPDLPVLNYITKNDTGSIDQEGEFHTTININFTDNASVKNYYEIKVFYLLRVDDSIPTLIKCQSDDLLIKNEGLLDYDPNTLIFNDELINGKNYNLKLICKNYTINGFPHYLYNPDYKIIAHFRAISEEYYLYKKKLIVHLYNQGGDFFEGIGEPVQMYTNIENGFGIFAGYSCVVDTVTKDDNE
jgi:hypothetical protein